MPTSRRRINGEASDANSFSYSHAGKRPRYDAPASSKFKGVVQQQNGNWGAQIYANHQRIWLGTFKSEEEAAMAYDSAAIKLRNGDSQRNFPWTNITVQEPDFQNHYTKEAILNMIKDGSYSSNFSSYLDRTHREEERGMGLDLIPMASHGGANDGLSWKPLFQKELTPSDVGKLNRLVIPKKYAVKYFPKVSETGEDNGEGGNEMGNTRLVFYDQWMRLWKFRYCYWSSSQSFVFTRGWNRFVKEKKLKAKDIIIFYHCESTRIEHQGQKFSVIDVKRGEGHNVENEGNARMVEGVDQDEPRLELAQNTNYGTTSDEDEVPISQHNPNLEMNVNAVPISQQYLNLEKKEKVKLFGVEIS